MYGHVTTIRGVERNWGAETQPWPARLAAEPLGAPGSVNGFTPLARRSTNPKSPVSGMMSAFAPLTRNLNWYYVYIASKYLLWWHRFLFSVCKLRWYRKRVLNYTPIRRWMSIIKIPSIIIWSARWNSRSELIWYIVPESELSIVNEVLCSLSTSALEAEQILTLWLT